jgi:hypothetical protein
MDTTVDSLATELASAVEDVYAHERENGFLCLDALRGSVTFWVAQKIADASNSQLLLVAPAWLVEKLYEWVDSYRKSAHFGFVSNLGEVDHSDVFAKVSAVLPPKRALGVPDSLRTEEKQRPDGSFHEVFTVYESPDGSGPVKHGLYREYRRDGSLLEGNYQHGHKVGPWLEFRSPLRGPE